MGVVDNGRQRRDEIAEPRPSRMLRLVWALGYPTIPAAVSAFLAQMFVAVLISGVIWVGWLALGNDLPWWIAMVIAVMIVFAACRVLADPEPVDREQAEVR